MPAGSGAMLVSKVPAKRPLPCIVIVIHGVNDDGQFFPVIDQHICNGLNKRLGHDDLSPHKRGPWQEGSEATLPQLATSTTIAEEGRSPVIPFHWGYRPVDHETYRKEQLRYRAQLDARNHSPDLPYDTYFRDLRKDATKGYNCQDNLGNWLNDHFAKDGGPPVNATTNLVDMWGPGLSGDAYKALAPIASHFKPESAMHQNPHRIYYVHAAQRLADLILGIRRRSETGSDTINIIAHSQGTEISMLANFLVNQAGVRPVDCLILCDSPYGLDLTDLESTLPGKHQSREARVQTLVNLTKIMQEKRRPADSQRIVSTGVANAKVWAEGMHSRDNAGRIYNYFCPQDSIVSLPTVKGMGWQGADGEAMKMLGPNFVQRVFSNGHIVGKGNESFRMPDGAARLITGDVLPEPYTFHTQTGKDHLGEHLAGTVLAQEGSPILPGYKIVNVQTGAETAPSSTYATDGLVPANVESVQRALNAVGYGKTIVAAWYTGVPVNNMSSYVVRRYMTADEVLPTIGAKQSDWSQHSAILVHYETIEKCMAYDLAIGLNVSFDENHGEVWWNLLRRADWRNPGNPDKNANQYFKYGILPDPIKRQMNKPNLPAGVVNAFSPDYVGAFVKATPMGAISALKDELRSPQGAGQWPLPEPDVRG